MALSIVALSRADLLAQACDCARVEAPCAGYWGATAVLVGRVESIRRATGGRVIALSVLDGFRGVGASAVEVATGPAGHRCSVPFRVGREYMVYASRTGASEMLTTNRCSGTREVEDAAADLSYVRALKRGDEVGGKIGGQVLLARRNLDGTLARPRRPMAGIAVRVTKDGSAEGAITNVAGDFVVRARGAGRYSVDVDVPPGFYLEAPAKSVELIDARSCAEVGVVLAENGQVAGRVVDASGVGVPGLTIELASTNLKRRRRTITGRDGRFELDRLPPGRFLVRAGSPPVSRPVTVGAGESLALGELQLPAAMKFVPLSGVVLNADGTPAEGARVFLKGVSEGARIVSEPAAADFLGRFVIAGLAGTDYRLFADRTRDRRVDSSDEITLKAEPGAGQLRLVLRRRY
jgi:hypothetical protein